MEDPTQEQFEDAAFDSPEDLAEDSASTPEECTDPADVSAEVSAATDPAAEAEQAIESMKDAAETIEYESDDAADAGGIVSQEDLSDLVAAALAEVDDIGEVADSATSPAPESTSESEADSTEAGEEDSPDALIEAVAALNDVPAPPADDVTETKPDVHIEATQQADPGAEQPGVLSVENAVEEPAEPAVTEAVDESVSHTKTSDEVEAKKVDPTEELAEALLADLTAAMEADSALSVSREETTPASEPADESLAQQPVEDAAAEDAVNEAEAAMLAELTAALKEEGALSTTSEVTERPATDDSTTSDDENEAPVEAPVSGAEAALLAELTSALEEEGALAKPAEEAPVAAAAPTTEDDTEAIAAEALAHLESEAAVEDHEGESQGITEPAVEHAAQQVEEPVAAEQSIEELDAQLSANIDALLSGDADAAGETIDELLEANAIDTSDELVALDAPVAEAPAEASPEDGAFETVAEVEADAESATETDADAFETVEEVADAEEPTAASGGASTANAPDDTPAEAPADESTGSPEPAEDSSPAGDEAAPPSIEVVSNPLTGASGSAETSVAGKGGRAMEIVIPIVRRGLEVMSIPMRFVPESKRHLVDWVALSLAFWTPIVWILALVLN